MVAAMSLQAAVIDIDLNTAKSDLSSSDDAVVFVVNEDGELVVNWTATGGWEYQGVAFPIQNIGNITKITFEYKGDGVTAFGENGVCLYPYLRDSEGKRWFQKNYWPNLTNTEWQAEGTMPDDCPWDEADYELGERPIIELGFAANPSKAGNGTFYLRNIKIKVLEEGEVEDPLALTYNGEVLPKSKAFTRSQCGVVSEALTIQEVSGIACSRVTPGYIWMESDECHEQSDHIIATTENGQQKAMQINFPTLSTNGIRYWDWEDLCGGVYNGKNYLFVGAFGDNNEEDDFYSIVYFEEPAITEGTTLDITPSQIHYVYPDGKSHNAEALMYDNVEQVLYVITKVYYDVCQVFSLPMSLEYGTATQTLKYVCDLGVKSDIGFNEKNQQCVGFHLVTAADISPDGKYVLIKNHNNIEALYSWILYWERKDGESIAETVKRQPVVLSCYEYEWQGEAICWLDNDTFYTTSDSDGEPPIYKYIRTQEEGIASLKAENSAKKMLIGNTLYIRTDKGYYTIDGRKVR